MFTTIGFTLSIGRSRELNGIQGPFDRGIKITVSHHSVLLWYLFVSRKSVACSKCLVLPIQTHAKRVRLKVSNHLRHYNRMFNSGSYMKLYLIAMGLRNAAKISWYVLIALVSGVVHRQGCSSSVRCQQDRSTSLILNSGGNVDPCGYFQCNCLALLCFLLSLVSNTPSLTSPFP